MRVNAYTPDWTDGAVRRMMLEAGDALPDLLDLSRADITSYRQDKVSRAAARIDELESRSRWLLEEAERVPLKSPLDGHDLMKIFGRGPGPWLDRSRITFWDWSSTGIFSPTIAPEPRRRPGHFS